jgi:hypothetical protein
MHPLLADWRRFGAYLVAWAVVGALIAAQLMLAAPFGWLEALGFAVPLSLLFGFVGLGTFWVCQAAPLRLSRLFRSLGTQLVAHRSAALHGRGSRRATLLERPNVFPPRRSSQRRRSSVSVALPLTAALHYLLIAVGASQAAERRALEFEIASREAELRALRAQIHPHFLFNSLNSINALIAARPEEARKLCVRLGDFLRASLTFGSREAISLAEELALAEQLLSIEKVRFGERLSHAIVADDDARPARCRRCCSSPWSKTRSPTGSPRRSRAGRSASRRSAGVPSCGSRSGTRATRTRRGGRARASVSRT